MALMDEAGAMAATTASGDAIRGGARATATAGGGGDEPAGQLERWLVWFLLLHCLLVPFLTVPGVVLVYAIDAALGHGLPAGALFPLALVMSVALFFGLVLPAARRDGMKALRVYGLGSAALLGVLLLAHHGFAAALPAAIFTRFF